MRQATQLLVSAFALILASACSNGTTQSANGFYCTVSSASIVSGTNQVALTITASGGTPSYTLASVTAGGSNGTLSSGSSTFSYSSSGTILFSGLTNATLQNAIGSVTLYDSANLSATCSFSLGATTSTSSPICVMTPSISSPLINQADTFTLSVSSGGTGPYTFSGFSPGAYGTISSSLYATSTTQATVSAVYSAAGTSTPTATVTDSLGNAGTCTTSVYVQSGSVATSSGTLSCSLSHTISGSTVTLYGSSSSGQTLYFYQGDPGVGGTVISSGNPSTISYSSTGQKTVAVIMRNSSGVACNDGSPLYDTFYITTLSGSSYSAPACTVSLSPSTIPRGGSVTATALITAQGAGNVQLVSLNYSTSSYMTGSYVSSLAAVLNFPYAGNWPLTMTVRDAAGVTATCSGTEVVY